MAQIKAAALEAAEDHERAPDGTLFGDQDIGVIIKHRVPDDTVLVEVWAMGDRPKGKTGRKRDLQNLQEGILDGLQSIAYANDNQVVMLQMTREL